MARRPFPSVVAVVAASLLAACSGSSGGGAEATRSAEPSGSATVTTRPPGAPTVTATPGAAQSPPAITSDGRPGRALLNIFAIGLRDLPVVPYRGWTDDAPGTRIQNGGVAASPHGPRGGVGPGGVGNYQVTAHRTSSTEAFRDLPSLRPGHRVVVETRGVKYVYRIEGTRETSFRSTRSLAQQRAAVPGRPGAEPTKAFITLSTCATPEDHAAGNY